MEIGEWIKAFRVEKGFSIMELSRELKYSSPSTIYSAESDEGVYSNTRGYGVLTRIIKEYKMRPDDFTLANIVEGIKKARQTPRKEEILAFFEASRRVPIWMPNGMEEKTMLSPTTPRGITLAKQEERADARQMLQVENAIKPLTDCKLKMDDIRSLRYELDGEIVSLKEKMAEEKLRFFNLDWNTGTSLKAFSLETAKRIRAWQRDVEIIEQTILLLDELKEAKDRIFSLIKEKIYEAQLEKNEEAISAFQMQTARIAKRAQDVADDSKRATKWAGHQIERIRLFAKRIAD